MQTENRLLATPVSVLEKKAGIAEFKRFSYVNTVNSLAGGDITKWTEILNMPYERVFTKLLLNKTEATYQRKYAELINGS